MKWFIKLIFVITLIVSWLILGWPGILNFPPKIKEAYAAINYFGVASTPADNSTSTANPVVITPPGSMQTGDLAIMVGCLGGVTSGSVTVSATGGQSWTNMTQRNTSRHRCRAFYARFNGNWSASPSMALPSSTNSIGVMYVFRPTASANSWAVDVAEGGGTYSAPASSPFTVTITGITTQTNGALAVAVWTSADDNTWSNASGGSWTNLGGAQYRNTSGTYDQSVTAAYVVTGTAGATGDVSKNQTVLGGDAGNYMRIAFKEVPVVATTPNFSVGTGTYNNDQSVAISGDSGDIFCYTTDGSTPAANTPGTCSTGSTYSSPVSIAATGVTLKAIATNAVKTNSAVQSATYTLTVGGITSSPGAGTYGSAQSVTLDIATTTGAVAHYTTDGSGVSCSSTTYSGAINISITTTIKAIGCKTNYNSDTPISDLYTITPAVSISLTTDGSVSFGIVPLGNTKHTGSSDMNHPETVNIDSGPATLRIKSSNFTEGGNIWTLASSNGASQVKWEFSKDGTNWTTFLSPDPSDYSFDTNVAQGQTRNIYLKLTMPTSTSSYNQFSSSVTVVASSL